MTVLATAAGLADETALALGLPGDRLPVGHLRPTDRGPDVELAHQAVGDDLEVELAHAGDQRLAGLGIITDRLDLPAEVISLLYQHRWAVEIFFRFFKHVLGCRHLLSHCQNGIELETYAAIIACLLIALWTGRKPTLRTYEMLCFYFQGWAEEDELLAHIKKLQRHPA